MPDQTLLHREPDCRPRRIVVVGTAGSGKTTLAAQIGHRLSIPHVELDALHWEAEWTAAEPDVFRHRVAQALMGDYWVVDGNYSAVRDIVWGRVDTVIWLDYRLPLIMRRLLWRTMRRVGTGTELWNGNRERLAGQLGRDSIILWALQTYRRRRREYAALLADPEYAQVTAVHLRSPRETRRWLRSLSDCSRPHTGSQSQTSEIHHR